MSEIYLDNAATMKPIESIVSQFNSYMTEYWYNPSAMYSKGNFVRDKIESVRSMVSRELNCAHDEIYFTSGAAESNNWILKGFVDQCKIDNVMPIIITTKLEHKSVSSCLEEISKCEGKFIRISYVDIIQNENLFNSGCIDIDDLECKISYYKHLYDGNMKYYILVFIQYANSEIGTIQDIKKISEICRKYNTIFATDATAVFGHCKIDVKELGIDLLSASAQKLGGLKGTGFLYKKNNINIQPLICGSQERGKRGGTENVFGIISLGEAIKNIDYDIAIQISEKSDYMIRMLVSKFDCVLNGALNKRLYNNINITFNNNITGEALIYMLDSCGIYISAGSACNTNNPSPVLKAIGLSDEEISKTIRITLNEKTSINNINYVVEQIDKAIKVLE